MPIPGLQPGYQFTPMLIQLGDLTFGVVDTAGTHWHCATIDGWEGPDVRTTLTEREADHGAWMSPVYLTERVVTLAGRAIALNYESTFQVIEQVKAAASLTDTLLTVHETTPRQAVVRRSGKPLAQRLTDRVVDWSIQVTAPDPRLYGTTLHTGGPVHLPSVAGGLVLPLTLPLTIGATVTGGEFTARNIGSFGTRPLLTITGPVMQPEVIVTYPDGTQAVLMYTGSLAAGDVLTIDTDAHDAYLQGDLSRRRFISGQWPELPPGDSLIAFRASGYSSTATLTATWRPAWI